MKNLWLTNSQEWPETGSESWAASPALRSFSTEGVACPDGKQNLLSGCSHPKKRLNELYLQSQPTDPNTALQLPHSSSEV